MNRKGHSKTLIAAHHGNENALKAGVYSVSSRAERVEEIDAAIAAVAALEAVRDILRRDLAALTALAERMDQSLEEDGVRGRRGEPRRMVAERMRLNEKLRKTAAAYLEIALALQPAPMLEAARVAADAEPNGRRLAQAIAALHFCTSIAELTPQQFDPEAFLQAVIATAERHGDRVRARALLTGLQSRRPSSCICSASRVARDDLELNGWVDELREAGASPARADDELAALIQQIQRGERLEPWMDYHELTAAVADVGQDGVAEARGDGEKERPRATRESDPAVAPFWDDVLSPSDETPVGARLRSLVELDRMSLLPRCTCKPEPTSELLEQRIDRQRAAVVRVLTRKDYRAAVNIAEYPATCGAVRDVVAAAIAADEQARRTDADRDSEVEELVSSSSGDRTATSK